MSLTAYIALGSNLGNREQVIRQALKRLDALEGIRVINVSKLLQNPAVGGPVDSPPFLNAAAEIQTTLDAAGLLAALLDVEMSLGRRRLEKWGPRTIDLDLLFFADQIIERDGLIVPHPLMHQRQFVLEPLVEIAPQLIHPVFKKTTAELLRDL